MIDSSNLWTLLFLVFAGQGIFLSVLLIFHKGTSGNPNRFLSILLFLFSLNLLENVGYWTKYIVNFPHFLNVTAGFLFLYGPLFYLFVRARVRLKSKLEWRHLIHLFPFVLFSFFMLEYYLLSAQIKAYYFSLNNSEADLTTYLWQASSIILLISYSFVSIKMTRTANKFKGILKSIILSFLAFSLLMTFYYLLVHLIGLSQTQDYIIAFVVSVIIYQVGYAAILQPAFFNPLFNKRKSEIKYAKSGLSRNDSERLVAAIQELMDKEKMYLDGDLRINALADKLNVSTNVVSQAINEQMGLTFLEMVNKYRVDEACRLLSNGKAATLSLLGIAYESGFNNKTSFNRFFKKYIGQTPKQYRMAQHR